MAVRQDALLNLVRGAAGTLGFDEDDVWAGSHTFTFDVSAWEIWAPLLTGGASWSPRPSSSGRRPSCWPCWRRSR
ncbi:hypothetical protein NKH77_50055 [Streptomyces sp. M19]